jgi:hypothetical protein
MKRSEKYGSETKPKEKSTDSASIGQYVRDELSLGSNMAGLNVKAASNWASFNSKGLLNVIFCLFFGCQR